MLKEESTLRKYVRTSTLSRAEMDDIVRLTSALVRAVQEDCARSVDLFGEECEGEMMDAAMAIADMLRGKK
jgi:hypothetical protein